MRQHKNFSPRRAIVTVSLSLFSLLCFATTAFAADSFGSMRSSPGVIISWLFSFGGAILGLYFAYRFFCWVVVQDEGDDNMIRIAQHVRDGATAYLNQQYKVVALFFLVFALILAAIAFGARAQSQWVPWAFVTGGFFSGLAGWFGMKTATLASARTTQAAKTSLDAGLQIAFRSGAVMGLVVVGLGLLDICIWFAVLFWGFQMELQELTVTMLCFGMGASCQALFARVGGGIFTKAADVGADLVGKVEAGIPEDDPRNPATIADNVGDNVGDVAGMGADLYESYCGSILASAALGVAAFHGVPGMQMMSILLPMTLAAIGIAISIGGIHLVKAKEGATQKNLLSALSKGIDGSSLGVILVSFLLVVIMLVVPASGEEISNQLTAEGLPSGWSLLGIWGAIACGLIAGVLIGKWTERSTSEEYAPTRRIADQAATGPATVIIAGIAEGFYSVWVPIVLIGLAILASFGLCTGWDFASPERFTMGLYGVAIAAVGMLSTLGITLATDAYGPIADNAGGNAEMTGQDPLVRERTDALDSLGNTTAATGKGFAIGSAALTALALLAAYVESVRAGFEQWADNIPKVELIQTDDFAEASVFKLSEKVFALQTLEGEGDDAKRVEHAYLIFQSTPGRLDEDLSAELVEYQKLESGTKMEMNVQAQIDAGTIIKVEKATIPDLSRFFNLSIMNPPVLVGMFLGVMLAFVFCAMTMKAVGRAAGSMVEEVRRQFREIAGIMEGTGEPDYASCVQISTVAAQREMMLPGLLAIIGPIVIGMVLGVAGVVGMLAGGLTAGFAVAIMMANSGGAWDNAKKYIEAGAHGGKGTDAHKATVVGDTVGDPFKDTSGPSLNILIKLMSMVSIVFASFVVQYALNLF